MYQKFEPTLGNDLINLFTQSNLKLLKTPCRLAIESPLWGHDFKANMASTGLPSEPFPLWLQKAFRDLMLIPGV